ncbi:htyE [Symbiodinium natans]|uniref:HtyE protein n=1 Tax=Symbiodinium natans TaxID=878477 RepID=A0A812K7S8_9DINO|nr:htyE [Symbiodinium natans]
MTRSSSARAAWLLFQLSVASAVEHGGGSGDSVAEIEQVSIAKFRDGSAAERAAQVEALQRAFALQGMVTLVDTGIDQDLIDRTIRVSRDFFSLPRARKQHFHGPEGYPPRSFGAITSPRGKHYHLQQEDEEGNILNEWLQVRNTSVQVDWSDPYYSCPEGQEHYSSEAKHPEQQEWPEEVPGLQEATAAYYGAMEELSKVMYELFAVALGIEPDFFLKQALRSPIWPVTIAHYPPQTHAPAEDRARIQPHWDRTLFSMITSSDAGDEESGGGLQILVDSATGEGVDGRAKLEGRSVEWRSVVRPKGGYVVNVGEMMSRWSNGRMKHVVHRVRNPVVNHTDPGRISLMAYVLTDYDSVVECLPCKTDGSEPIYEATWVGELMNWGSKLPIYNQTKQEMMRQAQGLYLSNGTQTSLGEPTDVKAIEASLALCDASGSSCMPNSATS